MTRLITLCLALAAVLPAAAAVTDDNLPAGTVWYLHADLDAMRNAESGRELYRWFEGEVVIEVNEELGININEEVDRVTAYATEAAGTVVVIDGPVTRESREKLLALAQLERPLEMLDYRGQIYYHVGDAAAGNGRPTVDLDDLEESAYFTFDVPGKVIVASQEDELRSLMDRKGRIAGGGSHSGALFVLTAEKDYVQAGMRTRHFAGEDGNWNSNILRNTEQAALLVSDSGGLVAIEAQLVSTDPRMAESIGSIVSGLISLQAFNSGLESNLARVLQNTKVRVMDNVLSISTVLEASMITAALND